MLLTEPSDTEKVAVYVMSYVPAGSWFAGMVMPMKKLLSVVELPEMGRTVVQPLL